MGTALQIINTIRADLANTYKLVIPEAASNNLVQTGNAITSNSDIFDAFCKCLLKKVALTRIVSKIYKSPFERLRQPGMPMGNYSEEIFVNPSIDLGYSKDGTTLLKTYTPDAKTAYYAMNRQGKFEASINKPMLTKAFTSEQAFMEFFNSIVGSLYSGDAIEEYALVKNLIGKTIDAGGIEVIDSDIGSTNGAKELSKSIMNLCKAFVHPNVNFIPYNSNNKEALETRATTDAKNKDFYKCMSFCPLENQTLIMRYDIANEINFEYYAGVFNMDVVALKARTIEVDDIPSDKHDIYCLLCDNESIQFRDTDLEIGTFYNPDNLEEKAIMHHWEMLYISQFAKIVAFGKTNATK